MKSGLLKIEFEDGITSNTTANAERNVSSIQSKTGERGREHQENTHLLSGRDILRGNDLFPVLCNAPPPPLRGPSDLLFPGFEGRRVFAHDLNVAQVNAALPLQYNFIEMSVSSAIRPLVHPPISLRSFVLTSVNPP